MEAAGVGNTIATRGLVWRPHCNTLLLHYTGQGSLPSEMSRSYGYFLYGDWGGGAGGLNPMP